MGSISAPTLGWQRGVFALGAAAATVVVLGRLLHTPYFDPAVPVTSLKTVKIGLRGHHGIPLRDGERLSPSDGISVTFENPRLEGVQLVLYAVDAERKPHWFVPAVDRRGHRDGTSKGLPTTQGEYGLLPPTPLGDLPAGRLTFIALINPGVIQLDRIDAFTADERTPDGLRERFPDGVVLTWSAQFTGPIAKP